MSHADKSEMDIRETIDSNLLLLWGGALKNYDKNEYIFHEDQQPHFYHQLISGKIKMSNLMEDGKEFIQGFFNSGQSFGEPPIFGEGKYPASAITVEPSVVIRLNLASFKQLLRENFEAHWAITKLLSQRIIHKAQSLKGITCLSPEQRVLYVLNEFKRDLVNIEAPDIKTKVEYTRQQIADMTGLRVETVIRVMRNLFERKMLMITKGKVYY
jgi:CRP-like cAMP-binding protein